MKTHEIYYRIFLAVSPENYQPNFDEFFLLTQMTISNSVAKCFQKFWEGILRSPLKSTKGNASLNI